MTAHRRRGPASRCWSSPAPGASATSRTWRPRCSAGRPAWCGTPRPTSGGRRGGSPRRLRPRRPPADWRHRALLAGHARRRGLRRGRRAGDRLLQRLPDPDRGGVCCPAPCCATTISSSAATGRRSGSRTRRVRRLARATSSAGEIISLPISHGEGRYVADAGTIDELEANGRVVLRYVDAAGRPTRGRQPERIGNSIAGIVNAARQRAGAHAAPGARGRDGARRQRRDAPLPLAGTLAARSAGGRGASAMIGSGPP